MLTPRHVTQRESPNAPRRQFPEVSSYSQAWVDFLVKQIADDVVWENLGSFKA